MEKEKQKHRVRFITNLAYWVLIIALVYFILKYLINLVMPFFLATIFASVARPLAKVLSAKEKKKKDAEGNIVMVSRKVRLPYNAAAILSIIILLIVVLGIASVILVPIVNYLIEVVLKVPDMYTNSIQPFLDNLLSKVNDLPSKLDEPLAGMVDNAVSNLSSSLGSFLTSTSAKIIVWLSGIATKLPSGLLQGLICLIATVFIALDFDYIKNFFKKNMNTRTLDVVRDAKNSLVETVWQFLRSYFFIFLITMTEISVGLLILGRSHPLLLGILIAIFDAFPIVGSGMILLPWSVVTMITSGFWEGFGLLILYLVVVIARQIIEPKIVGKHVGLRPIVTLTSMYVGSKLFGGIGLFGLPIAAAIITNLNTSGSLHLFIKNEAINKEN